MKNKFIDISGNTVRVTSMNCILFSLVTFLSHTHRVNVLLLLHNILLFFHFIHFIGALFSFLSFFVCTNVTQKKNFSNKLLLFLFYSTEAHTKEEMAAIAPILHRARNFQWYWNSAMNPWSSDESWIKYTDIENEIIEDAYEAKKLEVEIDNDYIISLKYKVQYKTSDKSKQRPLKRVELSVDRNTHHVREERFALPIPVPAEAMDHDKLTLRKTSRGPDFTFHYRFVIIREPSEKTLADIVEEAACGIMEEGTRVNKRHEAEWLARQLREVKHFGKKSCHDKIPHEIGQTCVHLYTMESFWYKLINSVLRNTENITERDMKTLGPFSYLLAQYLRENQTRDIDTVYRGLTLTDEERQVYMEGRFCFTSFTSASINREKAEQFGNTLFIMYLDVYQDIDMGKDRVPCGACISPMSDFPDEEEFLLWPATAFYTGKYEFDNSKKKHIIYLRSTWF